MLSQAKNISVVPLSSPIKIGQGLPELWPDKQRNKQTNILTNRNATSYIQIQGYPQRMRLQRRLHWFDTVCFLRFMIPCTWAAVVHLNFRAGSTFPSFVFYLALWTGLAGATRLTRSDFMLHIGWIYFYQRGRFACAIMKLWTLQTCLFLYQIIK